MRHQKRSLQNASHSEALGKLKEYQEVNIPPVDSLADIAELFIQEAGINLTASPMLTQSLQGLQKKSKDSLGAVCAFDLQHTKGLSRLSFIVETKWNYLLLETIDPTTRTVSCQHLKLKIHLDDPKRMKREGQKIVQALRKFKGYRQDSGLGTFLRRFLRGN